MITSAMVFCVYFGYGEGYSKGGLVERFTDKRIADEYCKKINFRIYGNLIRRGIDTSLHLMAHVDPEIENRKEIYWGRIYRNIYIFLSLIWYSGSVFSNRDYKFYIDVDFYLGDS